MVDVERISHAEAELAHPDIRFPNFLLSWKLKQLGKVATCIKGKGISKSDIEVDGVLPCIRYGELYTTYDETIHVIHSHTNAESNDLVLSQENDVIIPSSGESALDIARASCVLVKDVALGGDLNIIRSSLDGRFLAYSLNNNLKYDIAKLAQGVSVVHLYGKQLMSLRLRIPTIPEQKKIADFLSAVDEKVGLLKRKKALLERYKKGVMQQLFDGSLRFKDEHGEDFPEWEVKRLGEVCEVRRGASPRPISDPKWFSEDSEIGWVRISDVTSSNKYLFKTTQYLSDEGQSKSRFVRENRIIMSICATIGKPIYTRFNVCIHDGFVVFEELELGKEFLYYYLENIQLNWYRFGQPGSQVNLNSTIVGNELIPCPCSKEQEKISDVLSNLDLQISFSTDKLYKMVQFKKSLLQQMFV